MSVHNSFLFFFEEITSTFFYLRKWRGSSLQMRIQMTSENIAVSLASTVTMKICLIQSQCQKIIRDLYTVSQKTNWMYVFQYIGGISSGYHGLL